MKTTILFVLVMACCAAFLSAGNVFAQILQVTSVTVDSVWNSDSSWQDSNGVAQQLKSRDCRISFTPQGEGKARMFIALSVDSGKTWEQSPNPLSVMDYALASTFITGQKATITVRVLGGDRPGTVFKMTARQDAPVIAGSPKIVALGLTAILTPGQSAGAKLSLRLAGATSTVGFCTISKVYWDALGDGTIDDSTTGANALSWTWLTQVPAGAPGQKRGVIARAVDKNGLRSVPETLSVKFGVIVDSVTDIDGNLYHVVQIGTQQWTMENLLTTKYNDGTLIPKDTSTSTWTDAVTPKFCYYGNATNADSIKKYGALYNWHVVAASNPKRIAPAGWHVPSDSEWVVLEYYLSTNGYNWDGTTTENKIAKSLATQTDWAVSTGPGTPGNDLTANNSTGFSGLPGGYRSRNGAFYFKGSYCYWWSVTEQNEFYGVYRNLWHAASYLSSYNSYLKSYGYSVRLVRD